MSFRTMHFDADADALYEADAGESCASEQLVSGERICRPGGDTRGNTMLSAAFVVTVMLGGGWVVLKNQDALQSLLASAPSLFSAKPNETAPSPVVEGPPPQQPLAMREVADAPGVEAGTAAPPTPEAVISPPSDGAADDAATEGAPLPLPPPAFDVNDPYQKRAAAVGLHPDVSRALLKRLSPTDYRNAATAIQTALAETPDTDVFAWPRPQQPKLAFFEVKFVRGASHDCRRYVVTVTKDRWSTTAPPMEKCGLIAPGTAKKT